MYICTLVLSCVGNITLVANNDIGGCSFTELKGVRNSNSATDGEPLIGVSVQVKGTSTGTITDLNGKYTLNVSTGQTLVFSYIGFMEQQVVATKPVINVVLKEDTKTLDEVVVVGYGTMKRSDLTGSVVSVTGDELKKSVVTSLDQALQGRAAVFPLHKIGPRWRYLCEYSWYQFLEW